MFDSYHRSPTFFFVPFHLLLPHNTQQMYKVGDKLRNAYLKSTNPKQVTKSKQDVLMEYLETEIAKKIESGCYDGAGVMYEDDTQYDLFVSLTNKMRVNMINTFAQNDLTIKFRQFYTSFTGDGFIRKQHTVDFTWDYFPLEHLELSNT